MPEKPQKFLVSLAVNLAVYGHDEVEARKTAQDWLQRTVRCASTVETNLVTPLGPVIDSSEIAQEQVRHLGNWDASDNAEISAERSRPEYVELLDRLMEAKTTDDYLLIRQDVLDWKNAGYRRHALPLVAICNLLDTLAEAVRWSENHQNGPVVWNLGGLFASLKGLVQKEHTAIHKWKG